MKCIVDVRADEDTGEFYLQLPEEILDAANLKIGDTINWVDNKDGSWSLMKMKDLDYYVVDVLSSFRCRYVVKAKSLEHAYDEVVYQEGNTDFSEFSQKHLGVNIIDGRRVTEDELMELHRTDNDYLSSWTKEQVINGLTNVIDYGDDNNVQKSDN